MNILGRLMNRPEKVKMAFFVITTDREGLEAGAITATPIMKMTPTMWARHGYYPQEACEFLGKPRTLYVNDEIMSKIEESALVTLGLRPECIQQKEIRHFEEDTSHDGPNGESLVRQAMARAQEEIEKART